jgi:hypothetical protein
MTKDHEACFHSTLEGLTSKNFNIEVQGIKYNIKLQRRPILVQNEDGQTSFLNEIQRREELEVLRKSNPIIDQGIVKTIYANLRDGIIISEFISLDHGDPYTQENLLELRQLLFELDINGFFEWDLTASNILMRQGHVTLFDFGYMYKYSPLLEYNNEGTKHPNFHPLERFETRYYMHYISTLNHKDSQVAHRFYKRLMMEYFTDKAKWIKKQKGNPKIIQTYRKMAHNLSKHLKDPKLYQILYVGDMYSMLALEIRDDLSGKCCSSKTLDNVAKMKTLIQNKYSLLHASKRLLEEDNLTKEDLLLHYIDIEQKVEESML